MREREIGTKDACVGEETRARGFRFGVSELMYDHKGHVLRR